MYKLQKFEKKLDKFAQNHRPVFNDTHITLCDFENPKAYGRGGGRNYKDTQYYIGSFRTYRFSHEWNNTDRWVAELKAYFDFRTSFLNGKEIFEESFDTNKLIELVEDSFKIYIDNILSLLGNEIRTVKLKNKFWSEKEDGYIFTIDGVEEKLDSISNQESAFTVTQSSLYRNGKNELCYFRNGDKAISKVPVKYEVVDKQILIDKIRKNFLVVANRFLSQNYTNSLNVPEASELISMSREQLLLIKDVYKNKTVWKDVIKK